MISFRRIEENDMPWDELRKYRGATIFHTRPWIDFIADFEGAEPVIATIQSDGQDRGYFMGLITKKFGLKILGSPFRGWNTYFMGFILTPGVSYREVLQAFPEFAFGELKCHFLMIVDADLKENDCAGLSYHVRKFVNFALDLTKSEEELFANMDNKSCRQHIHKAIRKGVVIEAAEDPGFVEDYYAQYQDVMAKQSLTPLYRFEYVRKMFEQLQPTGHLLLLRAKNPEGVCIATAILLVFNKVAVGWGEASWREHQRLNPNELIYWDAMKRAKNMGVEILQLADMKEQFKKKFGAYEVPGVRLMKARNNVWYYPLFVLLSINERLRPWKARIFGR